MYVADESVVRAARAAYALPYACNYESCNERFASAAEFESHYHRCSRVVCPALIARTRDRWVIRNAYMQLPLVRVPSLWAAPAVRSLA